MRLIWKILIIVVLIIAVLAVLLVVPHHRAQAAVEAYRAQLRRQGEKITIAELAPSVSAEEARNGRDLLAAANMLGYLTNEPSSMHWTSPGHALLGWAETNLITEETTNGWPDASAEVTKHAKALAALREVARKPFGFSLDYQQGFALLLPHLAQLKKTSMWLSGAATVALHEGDASNAWENLEAETELVSNYRSEPCWISQMVRVAMVNVAVEATWEALQYPGWSDEQLARWQRNWESFNLLDQMDGSLSMERELVGTEIAMVRQSYSNFTDAINPSWSGSTTPTYNSFGEILSEPVEGMKAHLRYHAWKAQGSYEEEVYLGQIFQAALEAMRRARTNDCFAPAYDGFNLAVTNLQNTNPGWERRFILGSAFSSTTATYLRRASQAETDRRMVVAAIALERYRRRYGKYPESLKELTPELLAKEPIDFMDGKPLRYHPRDDGTYLLYSVGEDGKDDGGDGSPPPTYSTSNKTWYRMRDSVWPVPATAEEVKAYEVEALKKVKKKTPGKIVPPMLPAGTNSTK